VEQPKVIYAHERKLTSFYLPNALAPLDKL